MSKSNIVNETEQLNPNSGTIRRAITKRASDHVVYSAILQGLRLRKMQCSRIAHRFIVDVLS